MLLVYLPISKVNCQSAKDSLTSTPTIALSDSSKLGQDTIRKKIPVKKDISTTIKYAAKDSMRMDVRKKIVYMYNDAKINYGEISLDAQQVDINWANNEMRAEGTTDSSGKKIGIPVFKQGEEKYTSDKIRYNFKTKKGLISGLVTQQGDGYIHGERVKRKNSMLYINHAKYTTCNLVHPHFYINASKLKVIPDKKIVAGPFNMVFSDIHTPIGFLFGFFPVPKKKKSGIIFPTYGENANGFFLQNGGYYFAISDYMDLTVYSNVFSKGTFSIRPSINYKKRYKFNGALSFDYFNAASETNGEIVRNKNYNFRWRHSTETKGTTRLSADMAISSADYNKVATFNIQNRNSNDFRSNVDLSKTFKGTPFSMNIKISQSQNVNTRIMTFSGLPEFSFNMQRIYPFKKGSVSTKWHKQMYQQINFSSSLIASSNLSNQYFDVDSLGNRKAATNGLRLTELDQIQYLIKGGEYFASKEGDTLFTSDGEGVGRKKIYLNGSRYGSRMTVPISTTFKLFKHFNFSPGVTFTETWSPRSLKYETSDSPKGTYKSEVVNGFHRAWSWSGIGTNISTLVYGTVLFKKSKLMGIRHVMTPTIGYNYSPDLTNPFYGGFQNILMTDGSVLNQNGQAIRQPITNTFTSAYVFSGGRAASNISFSLQNVFEAKVRTSDTSKPTKKFNIFDNLNLNGSYNMIADSFNLSLIPVSARTNIKDGRFSITLNAAFDPYTYQVNPKIKPDKFGNFAYLRNKEFAYESGQGLANFTNGFFAASANLNPSFFKKNKPKTALDKNDSDEARHIKANPDHYVDFNMPWNLNLSYQLNFLGYYFIYNLNNQYAKNSNINTHTITISGDLSITEKWKLNFRTDYNFLQKKFPNMSIGIIRDLHCWAMSMNIIKFGDNYTFFFNINPKSSLLQDLKLTKRSPNLINNFF